MIDLKILGLFCRLFDLQLSSFFRCAVMAGRAEKYYFISCSQIGFYLCLLLLFSVVFSNVSSYNTRMEIMCSFSPVKSII